MNWKVICSTIIWNRNHHQYINWNCLRKEKGNFPDVLIVIWRWTNHGFFLIDVRLQVFCGSAEWYSDLGTAGPAEYIWEQWGRICPHLLLMGSTLNPLVIRGADYAHHIGFSPPDLKVFRRPCSDDNDKRGKWNMVLSHRGSRSCCRQFNCVAPTRMKEICLDPL